MHPRVDGPDDFSVGSHHGPLRVLSASTPFHGKQPRQPLKEASLSNGRLLHRHARQDVRRPNKRTKPHRVGGPAAT